MSATDPLKKEHTVLRQMLEALEGQLQAVPQAPLVLQQQCHALARFVDAHIRKEEAVFAPYTRRLTEAVRRRMMGDHADEWMLLHELDIVLSSKLNIPTGDVIARLNTLVDELRDHLDIEERTVFTVIDRAEQELARRGDAADVASQRGGPNR